MPYWTQKLRDLRACTEAVTWAEQFATFDEAWAACERGDWMLWLAGRLAPKGTQKRRTLVLTSCQCARLVLKHVPKGEDRPRIAIETAEAWARREGPSLQDVRNAAVDAANAANAADASASAAAAAAAAAASARKETLKACADIARRMLTVNLGD